MKKAKKKNSRCRIEGCRKAAAKGRLICNHHKRKQERDRNPHRYHWQALKDNAKRRGKEFTLTLEEFTEFCYETNVLHGRGRTSLALHIDRKDDEKGYTRDNIQVLTNRENLQKEHRRRKTITYDYLTGAGRVIERVPTTKTNDVPF